MYHQHNLYWFFLVHPGMFLIGYVFDDLIFAPSFYFGKGYFNYLKEHLYSFRDNVYFFK